MNCIKISPPTPNGLIFASWVAPPVTLDKFEWTMETDTKHDGRRHNRLCKAVSYTIDFLFKLVSQYLIHLCEWGCVIRNSFDNINKIKDLSHDKDESEFQPSENSEESNKK